MPRPRNALLWAASVATLGLLLFTYRHLERVASREAEPWQRPFVNEMTGAFVVGVLFLGVRRLVDRYPLRRAAWGRRIGLYAAALVAFGVLATSLMWVLRSILHPLAGLGPFDYGVMPVRYFMEFPLQVIAFTAMVVGLHAAAGVREAKEREVLTARLEASLARAELRNLRLQLQPHFLFNALNTISATMYRDPAAADELLDDLGELLRASLRTAHADEVALADELEVLDAYVSVMRARFGERLAVTVRADEAARGGLVPSMLLQPLVENAVRHGAVEKTGRGTIDVSIRRDGERLVLEVADDGPGVPAGRDPLRSGLGLSATAERLRLLYAGAQSLEAGNGEGGGFRVRAVLPWRTAEGRAA